MLEKPALPEDRIAACLHADFGVRIADVGFLPLGADPNSAVYRAVGADGAEYFVKLRRGAFDEIAVMLPRYLSDHGVPAIIPPMAARDDRLWARLDDFTITMYPFVNGRTASEVRLSEAQWRDFGEAMKALHSVRLPPELAARVARETYSSEGREQVAAFLKLATAEFEEPVAVRLAAFLKTERATIIDLVERAERYGVALRTHAPDFVVCHSDVHADNLLIDERGAVHVVDWDEPIFASKERDLMFVGGGQRFAGYGPIEETELFYRGYGDTEVDRVALAYHRYERILQDILVACRQLLLTQEGGANRALEFGYLPPNFLPNGTIDLARRADPAIQTKPVIRMAEVRDLAVLSAVEAAADTVFPEGRLPSDGSTYPADKLAQATRAGLLRVAEVDGSVVGFAVSEVIGPMLHLYLLAVHPDYGRRGIGRELVEWVIAESVRRDLSGVTLTTFEDLKWNAPFYRKLGFRVLSSSEQSPMLAQVLSNEQAAGLRSRVAMRYDN